MPEPVYFHPEHFVSWLTEPGLASAAYPEPVALSKYLCAVGEYGGNKAAVELQQAVVAVASEKKVSLRRGWKDWQPMEGEFDRLFTGQGRADHFMALFAFIHEYRADLAAWKPQGAKSPPLGKYFVGSDQKVDFRALVDDGRVGLDCIGFAGRYFEAIGVFNGWPGLFPRHYLDRFDPVSDIGKIAPMCVLVWVNGTHIAVIDKVHEGQGLPLDEVKVDICQSSDSAERHGPQRNVGVILKIAIPNHRVLNLADYKRAVDVANPPSEEEKAKLRESLKETVSRTTGYRGGLYFQLKHLGSPAAPVPGFVYVGRRSDLSYAKDPS
jgi:hypothetical protein